jgi:hypothetical protein
MEEKVDTVVVVTNVDIRIGGQVVSYVDDKSDFLSDEIRKKLKGVGEHKGVSQAEAAAILSDDGWQVLTVVAPSPYQREIWFIREKRGMVS